MDKNEMQKKIYCMLTMINPTWNIKLRYYAMYKKPLPLDEPSSFVEKLLWLRINYYNNSPLVAQCADKVAVRKFVASRGFEHLLNDIYGIYDTVEDVPWGSLPQQFAMKWNFGATYNLICDDKNNLDIQSAKKQFASWGGVKYWLPFAEMQYKKCKKQIILEKYLDTGLKFLPSDYKLYCFDGEVKAILFIADRDHEKKGAFYTPDWAFISTAGERYQNFDEIPDTPKSLSEMIRCAEILSQNIPFVRIDFYDINGKAVFGEMTFTPTAGLSPAQTLIDGHDMGDFINIAKDYSKYLLN